MEQLLVTSQTELRKFGCPGCGGANYSKHLAFGTCSFYGCDSCQAEFIVVQASVKEAEHMNFEDTHILDLIGRHPYRSKAYECMIN